MKDLWICTILAWLLSVCSCGGGSKMDARWKEIDRLCDSVPEQAIGLLDSINQDGLSEKDLNRYRLLWIKSRDKAYVAHTSDTLILDVVDYYARHRREGLYPEALYYGGRVYSDLGDFPTALEFFQKSLDEIPEDDTHLRFKGTVLDQTGRLLHTLRLDSAAIEYLEKSLLIESKKKDSYGIAFTHGLLASSFRRQKNLKKARCHMEEAIRAAYCLKEVDRQTIQCEFAEILYKEGNIDSAVSVIRSLPSIVDSLTTPYCLAVAAEIYKEATILDTAYIYARQLTKLKTSNNRKTGYKVIFSDELKGYVSKDTLLKLMPEYRITVEDYLNTHNAEQALVQNARYNYSTHVRAKQEAELKLRALLEKLWIGGMGVTLIFLAGVSVVLWRRYHKSKKDSQIMEGIILSDKLKEKPTSAISQSLVAEDTESTLPEISDDKRRILEDIKKAREMNPSESVDKTLKASPLYKDLKEKSENKNVMGKDITWRMIEELIESVSPGFDNRLEALAGSQITPAERNVAYLMKCGFTQAQMASLLAKSPSTISAQRTSLAKKIGYDKSSIAAIIVRL